MTHFTVSFIPRDRTPEKLIREANDLGVTPEQLIKRYIAAGLAATDTDSGPAIPGHSLEDFLVQNDVLKPR